MTEPPFARPLLAASVVLLATGCASRYVQTDRGPQAYYQTAFPTHDTSAELERIMRSMRRVQVTGFYTTYRFSLADSITAAAVRSGAAFVKATERFEFDHAKAGSGTIIARTGNRVTLLTSDHVIELPDTLLVFYGDPATRGRAGGVTPYVESVSLRNDRRDVVVGFLDSGEFSVVARDTTNDLALISVLLTGADALRDAPALQLTLGDASKLRWGSFVYVLGYPRGFRMVTRGIVSDPNRTEDNSFLLDGLFNRGISGGLVLAVRGDTGALEWVGLASAASADIEFPLMPERRAIEETGLLVPYQGRLYIERAARIDYGITFSVPATVIRRFLQRSAPAIGAAGAADRTS